MPIFGTDPLAAAEHVVVAAMGIGTIAGAIRRAKQAKKDAAAALDRKKLAERTEYAAEIEKQLLKKQLEESEKRKVDGIEAGQHLMLEGQTKHGEMLKTIGDSTTATAHDLAEHKVSDVEEFGQVRADVNDVKAKSAEIIKRLDGQDVILKEVSTDVGAIKKALGKFGRADAAVEVGAVFKGFGMLGEPVARADR